MIFWRRPAEFGAISNANRRRPVIMGLLDEAEKLAGAVAAVEGMKKLDPNANLLEEAAAAITGFEGAGALENLVKEKMAESKEEKG